MRPLLLAGALVAWATVPAAAAATGWGGDARAQVRLITGSDMAGQRAVEAGLEFRYAPGWHGYWRTPGDAGVAPVFDWTGSTNLKATTIAWPAPTRLVISGLQNGVYDGRFILPVTIEPADPHQTTAIALAIDYAACSNICVPIHADLSLSLPAGSGGASVEASALAAARVRVPGLPSAGGIDVVQASTEPAGSTTQLVVVVRSRTAPFKAPDLFVEGAGDGLPPPPTIQLTDGGQLATLTSILPDGPPPAALTLTLVDGSRSAEFRSAAAGEPLPRPGP